MSVLSILALGLGLGLRHATDADHVVVVSSLVQREPGVWKAARIAALWGLGHTMAFLALGSLIVLAGVRLPASFELAAEVLVALLLVTLGGWHLASCGAQGSGATERRPASAHARPIVIGIIHGLAGSAGIALLVATTIGSHALAVAYLLLVAIGTVLGMVTLTVLLSRPIGWATKRRGRLSLLVRGGSALLSIVMGMSMLIRAIVGDGHT